MLINFVADANDKSQYQWVLADANAVIFCSVYVKYFYMNKIQD
jgi:hypothetical protein